jgi:hypothetical protein
VWLGELDARWAEHHKATSPVPPREFSISSLISAKVSGGILIGIILNL